MNTSKIINILARSLRSGRSIIQQKSLASHGTCYSESETTCQNQDTLIHTHVCDGNIVYSVLASGLYPYRNVLK